MIITEVLFTLKMMHVHVETVTLQVRRYEYSTTLQRTLSSTVPSLVRPPSLILLLLLDDVNTIQSVNRLLALFQVKYKMRPDVYDDRYGTTTINDEYKDEYYFYHDSHIEDSHRRSHFVTSDVCFDNNIIALMQRILYQDDTPHVEDDAYRWFHSFTSTDGEILLFLILVPRLLLLLRKSGVAAPEIMLNQPRNTTVGDTRIHHTPITFTT